MPATVHTSAQAYLSGLTDVIGRVKPEAIEKYADMLFEIWREDRQVFFFGNGGSASTASHHALDAVKTACAPGHRALRAFALCDNIGILTAVGNDLDYSQVFSLPLAAYSRPGDLAVAISASGNSPNIVTACQAAKQRGMKVVALTGFTGGKVASIADLQIHIPNDNYGIVEDLHLTIGHIAAQILKSRVEKVAK